MQCSCGHAVPRGKEATSTCRHARHNISTGRLEGFNNKVKVSKRVGYGYRNENYFFTIVRYLSIPSVRGSSPIKT